MDPLFQLMMERQMAPPNTPAIPPNEHSKTPQADKRFDNAQKVQSAYRNNWTPNPVLLRLGLGNKS